MAKQVFSKEERHEQGVKEGIKLAKKVGLARVSIGKVAAVLKVTAPLLFHVFGSRDGFHKAIAKAAKAQGVVFPEAEPTVRAARAARVAEKTKTVKALKVKVPVKAAAKKSAVPVVKPPVKAATKKVPKVVPPKVAKGKSANASIAKAKAADKRARAEEPVKKSSGKVKVPKKLPPELSKFPALPVPSTATAAA